MSGGVQREANGRPSDLDDAVTGEGVAPVFQPIVSLPSGTTVGFEALARWPHQPHLGPQSVFAYAVATEQVTELDRLCIDRAVDGALRGGLTDGALLGVNSEPASDYTGRADSEILQRGHDKFELVFELTERDLLGHLPRLLRKVAALRADGITIALDDVGANPESLALLDIVCPEVIKLANNLIQAPPSADTAKTGAAIMAHRERRGTLIIAEGIETDQHFEQALAWGATLGQGFLFGRPGPLPAHAHTVAWSPPAVTRCADGVFDTPFDVVAGDPAVRRARGRTLVAISRHLEEQARNSPDVSMVLTAVQDRRHFGSPIRDRYAALATVCPLVAVFGADLVADQTTGARIVELPAGDPLCTQWVVVTLGSHTAAALIARECGGRDAAVDDGRQFDYVVTHDRSVVTAAAVALLSRVP
ncbi:EAL domain-containing protein [Mycolicibacterium sp.]|uniref:sensor domain-containing phosphodiesterase n=1 Tax=Mycolicibacterium sp. TaxID=2320850 RepID=UPI001A340A6D|nr:EAL domain-containing protein [Mycolicibacterium sp.]MBJ7340483.1 EAL domain-containing protein [Mycolicibacterium sp.]